jgi:hypothetical protein
MLLLHAFQPFPYPFAQQADGALGPSEPLADL